MPPTIEELLLRVAAAEARAEQERREKERAVALAEYERREKEQARRENEVLQQREAPSCFLDYVRRAEKILFRTFHIKPALVESDPDKTKTYTTTSVNGKFYPQRLRPWDFESEHGALFRSVIDAFGDAPLFPALTDVLGVSRDLSPEPVDEQDLRPFIRTAIEKPAARIVTEYLRLQRERDKDRDKDTDKKNRKLTKITFQNNAYGLDLVQENIPPDTRDDEAPPAKRQRSPVKKIGIPDRWCVGYNGMGVTHILVGEYKAAHKLPAQVLTAVLSRPPREDFFIQTVKIKDVEPEIKILSTASVTTSDTASTTPTITAAAPANRKKLPKDLYIARVLCQAYHYIVTSGLEFGYVSSGDGLIFLRVLEDDPWTLYYFWSVFPVPPNLGGQASTKLVTGTEDVENTTDPFFREPHQTALAYLVSLCLLAIQSTVRPMSWIDARDGDLARWPHSYKKAGSLPLRALLPSLEDPSYKDKDTSGGSSGGGNGGSGGGGSGNLDSNRGGSAGSAGKGSRSNLKRPHSSKTPEGGTTTRTHFIVEPPTLPYCTQACLRGLCNGSPLDDHCPNSALHRTARSLQQQQPQKPPVRDGHPLTVAEVRAHIVAQLAQNMDKDCECLEKWGFFGAHGVLFKLAVTGYGYTFVAKGVQAAHRDVLENEAAIYTAMTAYQGRLLPVFLGLVDLERPLPLHSLARIPHLMLLSYAGPPLPFGLPVGVNCEEETERTTDELEAAGLYNDDVHPSNLVWNQEAGRIMQLDFDQAYVRPKRTGNQPELKQPSSPPSSPPVLSPVRSPLTMKRHLNANYDGSGEDGELPAAKRVRDDYVTG